MCLGISSFWPMEMFCPCHLPLAVPGDNGECADCWPTTDAASAGSFAFPTISSLESKCSKRGSMYGEAPFVMRGIQFHEKSTVCKNDYKNYMQFNCVRSKRDDLGDVAQ